MPEFYDTHAHLDFPDFAADLPQIVERAREAGITRIITIGTDLESSQRAVEFSERFEGVYAAVGWHPCSALEAPEDLRPALRKLAGHPKVVALGETGLDYHHLPSEKPEFTTADDERLKVKQAVIFKQHMEVAEEFGLNCVVHERDALEDVLLQMQPFVGRVRGVFHCFVNTPAARERIHAMGSMISITGIVTFKNAATVRETVAATPADQLMLETDCPYLAPMPYRGKRCEPAYVKEISIKVAEVKGILLEQLSVATCAAAHRFFPKLK